MVERSDNFVLMSHCILAQATRAEGCEKSPSAIDYVVRFCLDNEINMVQMPCPETLFPLGGLPRDPHGKKWYEANGFRAFCKELVKSQVAYAKLLTDAGNNIVGIIGVHFSPACSTIKDSGSVYMQHGIYMEELELALADVELYPKFISTNPDWHNRLAMDLSSLIEDQPRRAVG